MVRGANDFVLGEEIADNMTPGGLHIPTVAENPLCRIRVHSVGPGTDPSFIIDKGIKTGAIVYVPRANVRTPIDFPEIGKELLCFPAQFVVAVDEND